MSEARKQPTREDRIIYHKATGALYYDSDGTGAAAQVKIATLSNKAKLVLSRFRHHMIESQG